MSLERTKDLWYCSEWGNFYRDGKRAGCLKEDGYRRVSYKGKSYYEHRLAFYFMEGSLPEEDTDHVNRIRNDNRWENLRRSSRKLNLQNTKRNNKFIGVRWIMDRKRWRVYGTKVLNKSEHLGYYRTHLAACTARHNWEMSYE